MKKKKRALTLIEVFIYFALCSSIVSTLFFSLKNNSTINFKLKNTKTDIMQRQRIQQRLGSIFFSLIAPPQQNPLKPKEDLLSFKILKGRPELHFHFNNGIDPDPAFCNTLSADLTLNQEGILVLTVKSSENKQERKEAFLSEVAKLEFKFLLQDSLGTFNEIEDLENSALSDIKAIKMLVWKTCVNKPLSFVFWLPFQIKTIDYLETT